MMLAYKLTQQPENNDLTYNFNDSLVTLVNTCSVTDTVQGVVILNLIIYILKALD